MLTLTNLFLGLMSILFLTQAGHPHKTLAVMAFILLGAVADFLDGYLARRLNASTDMGKQLDSFADLVTFGIAPISLVNYLVPPAHSALILVSSLVFVFAGAYRLARYNLGDFSDHFVGLPIPVAGVAVAVYCAAYLQWGATQHPGGSTVITALFVLSLSALMVSRKKVKRVCGTRSKTLK